MPVCGFPRHPHEYITAATRFSNTLWHTLILAACIKNAWEAPLPGCPGGRHNDITALPVGIPTIRQSCSSFLYYNIFFVISRWELFVVTGRNACISKFMDIVRTFFSGNPHQALIYCDLCTDIRLHLLPGIRMIHIILGAFLSCHIIMPDHLL